MDILQHDGGQCAACLSHHLLHDPGVLRVLGLRRMADGAIRTKVIPTMHMFCPFAAL